MNKPFITLSLLLLAFAPGAKGGRQMCVKRVITERMRLSGSLLQREPAANQGE